MPNDVTTRRDSLPAAPTDDSGSMIAMIGRAAADPHTDIVKMQALLDMQERIIRKRAEQQFIEAMSAFKARPPTILKTKQVAFGDTAYKHATLGNVCRAIIEGLSAHGISHRWLTSQNGPAIKVECILTHIGGHSESTALESKADDSGKKNSIQAIGSAVTYLQRYTLLAATGLATDDMDDDGRGGRQIDTIGEGQMKALEDGIAAKGMSRQKFLAYFKAAEMKDMLVSNFGTAMKAINEYVPKAQRTQGTAP